MNYLYRPFLCLLLLSAGLLPLSGATWYSQGSGVWGDAGTPGLWNTAANGSGMPIDGTDFPAAGDAIVIQASHQIELTDFSAVGNILDILQLTIAQDAFLFGGAAIVINVHGTAVTVEGSLNCPSLQLLATATAAFNTLKGNGSANIESVSFEQSLQTNSISIDLNTRLQTDLSPFNDPTAFTVGPWTVEKDKTLEVIGSVFLDADAAGGYTANTFDTFNSFDIYGTLKVGGDLHFGNNNNSNPIIVQVLSGGTLELGNNPVIGGSGLSGAGVSVVDVQGTFVTRALDPVQATSSRFVFRMNTNSICLLNGGAGQLLDADVAAGTYFDVQLAGNGPKQMNGNVEIQNEVDMGTMLELGNFDLFLSKMFTGGFFGTDVPILNFDHTTYIANTGTGKLRMWVPAANFGGSNTPFPIGRGSFTPFFVTNSSAGSGYFDAWVEQGVNPVGAGTTTDFVDKTWHFAPVATFTNALSLQFYWNLMDEQSNFDRNACWGSRHDGSQWDSSFPVSASNLNVFGTAQYAVLRGSLTDFGAFAIASDGLLPVEYLDFRVTASAQGNHLQWRTATELNNSHFEIQYSADGSRFEKIGQIKGHGTTQDLQDYEWYHQPVISATYHYYRLKQVDHDGQFNLSDMVVVQTSTSTPPGVQVYPNPAVDHLTILIPSNGRMYNQMFIFSIDGRRVWQQSVVAGDQIEVEVADFSPGSYIIGGKSRSGAVSTLGAFIKK